MIIAGKNLDYAQNNEQFDLLLEKTITILKELNFRIPFKANDRLWSKFEEESFNAMNIAKTLNPNEVFSKWEINLISGHYFPDITTEISANRMFGVEVKTTQANKWTTLGGSIMESTRKEGVERINVLFAKLNPFDVQTKRYEDCISDVAVTHSPRYVIDFNIDPENTIFKKIKVDYSTIWKSEKPFESFRKYFEEKSKRDGTELWYIESKDEEINIEEYPTLEIKFFNELSLEKRTLLISKAMIIFPEIFDKTTNYKKIAMWLLKMGILNNSLRDLFSAGGKVNLFNTSVPSKFGKLYDLRENIIYQIKEKTSDFSNGDNTMKPEKLLELWKSKVIKHSSYDANVKNCVKCIMSEFKL